MSDNRILAEIREALEGRPGEPIVLGVCSALSKRWAQPVWGLRLATIILGLVWTLPVLAGYILAGFFLRETGTRTRQFFAGLTVLAREWLEKFASAWQRNFGGQAGSRSGS